MSVMNEIAQALINGNEAEVVKLVTQALESSTPAIQILNEGLVPGMDIVGKQFKAGELFIPEVISSAETMKKGLAVLKPKLVEQNSEQLGRIVIGTVQGDVHDVGKNLVSIMFEGAGFSVMDLGTDSTPEQFVKAAEEFKADIVALSALLTTTMPAMQRTIEALKEAGLRQSVKVIVGGAPVSADFAEKIGADGYAGEAVGATQLAKSLLER